MNTLTLTPEQFEMLLKPNPNVMGNFTLGRCSFYEAVEANMSEGDREIVRKLTGFGRDISVSTRFYGAQASEIKAVGSAKSYLESLADYIESCKVALVKAEALKSYYASVYAILNSCEYKPVFILTRNDGTPYRERIAVTYKIYSAKYNVQLKHFEVEWGKPIEQFEGKQHREAKQRIMQLVHDNPGTKGFMTKNGSTNLIKYDQPDFI